MIKKKFKPIQSVYYEYVKSIDFWAANEKIVSENSDF